MDNPIRALYWLASYPKSGNTWARLMLNAYVFGNNDINARTFVRGDNDAIAYQSVVAAPLQSLNATQVALARYAALMQISAQNQHDRVVLKTHNARTRILGTIDVCPSWITRAAVYIVRDPRDVVISYAEHMGTTHSEAVDLMLSSNAQIGFERSPIGHVTRSWVEHVDSWGSAPFGVALVRYEDMLAHPKRELRRILEAFEFSDIDDDRIAAAVAATSFEKLRSQELATGFGERSHKSSSFFARGKAGSWRTSLDSEQVARLESAASRAMQRLGYL